MSGATSIAHDAIVEPFVEGRSERILLVGAHIWHLRYESADWRKNVAATVTTIAPDEKLVARARRTAERLGLMVCGIDYIVDDAGATLLEVNAYPGFDDVPDATEAFIACTKSWWSRIMDPSMNAEGDESI